MGLLDVIILIAVAVAAFRGYRRGLVREVLGLASTTLVFVVGFRYGGVVGTVVSQTFGFATGPLTGTIGFLAISLTISTVVGLFLFLWNRFTKVTHLSGLDSLGGAAFGVAKTLLIALVVLLTFSVVAPGGTQGVIRSSMLAPQILKTAPILMEQLDKLFPQPSVAPEIRKPGETGPRWEFRWPKPSPERRPVGPPRDGWRQV